MEIDCRVSLYLEIMTGLKAISGFALLFGGHVSDHVFAFALLSEGSSRIEEDGGTFQFFDECASFSRRNLDSYILE